MKSIKLMFDECVGKPIVDELARFQEFSTNQFELAHVLDQRQQGVWDEVWIPQLDPEDWIVVTGDRGRGGKAKGAKLPLVCEERGISYIALGPSVHKLKTDKKIIAFETVWDEIAKLVNDPPGSAYLLSMAGGRAKITPKGKKPKAAKRKPKSVSEKPAGLDRF